MSLALRREGIHGFWPFAGTLSVAMVLLVFALRWWQLQVKNRLYKLQTSLSLIDGERFLDFFGEQQQVQISWRQQQALQGQWTMPDGSMANITLIVYAGGIALHAQAGSRPWPPNHNLILCAEIERILPSFRLLYLSN